MGDSLVRSYKDMYEKLKEEDRITVHDLFLGCALIGVLYDSIPGRTIPGSDKQEYELDVELVFKIADAMLAAREE